MKQILLTQQQIDKYWTKINVKGPDDCWEWTGNKHKQGYGMFNSVKGSIGAHRVAVYLDNRDPGSKVVMHTCDNTSCVNPRHLKLGTQLDNIKDMVNKNRQSRGETSNRNILTEAQVLDIKARHIKGTRGVKNSSNLQQLADEYGVTYQTIYSITKGLRWKHI